MLIGMTTMYEWFRRTARRYPDLAALEVGDDVLGYAELDRLATWLADQVTTAAGGRPTAIGLCCTRDVAAYAGYLAASRAGAIVVPLNPSAPVNRNVTICEAAGVNVIITSDAAIAPAGDAGPAEVRLTGPWWRAISRGEVTEPAMARPGDVAYLLFTSGSTGRPKGVPIRHRQLADYLAYCADRYAVGPGSRLSQTFDLTFDPSVFDMFVAWYGGGTVVVPQAQEVLTPTRFVGQRRITHWFSVPSVISLSRRLRALPADAMPQLRWSLFAGEQLTLDQARDWAAAAPGSVIENLYGPTELTITCTCYRLPQSIADWPRSSNGTVPIGRPYPHMEAALLTDDGSLVGVPALDGAGEGELCMRGPQRFEGYLDPADNHGHFLRGDGSRGASLLGNGIRPAAGDWYRTGDHVRLQEGELVHLGRADDQLKISGYRIEPAEIEYVLREHPDVHEVVVLATGTPAGIPELHALYTGEPVAGHHLISHGQQRLPAYMVPAYTHHVDRFPLNANGKIDRSRLRELLAARSA